MLRQRLQDTPYPFLRPDAVERDGFLRRAFPARFQQFIERTDGDAIMDTPVIGDRRARHLEEPVLHAQRAAFAIYPTYCLNKYLRCQVLGPFPVSDLAIDVAVNLAEMLLIEFLKFLHIHAILP